MPPMPNLIDHLEGHVPLDSTEASHQRRIVVLVRRAGVVGDEAAWSRRRFDPGHLTGSAFLVARRPVPAVLLIRHPTLGRWLQPGGHVEAEDDVAGRGDLAAVAARELREETGIIVPADAFVLADLDVHAIPPNPRKCEPAHQHLDCRYVLVLPERPEPAGAAADACEARWWTLAEAAKLEPGFGRLVRRLGLVGGG